MDDENEGGTTPFKLRPKDSQELVHMIQNSETGKFKRHMEKLRDHSRIFVNNPYTKSVCISGGKKKSEVLTDIHLYLYASYQIKDIKE